MSYHTITFLTQPDPLLILRLVILCRKYELTILKLENNHHEIILSVDPQRDNIEVAVAKMRKLPTITSARNLMKIT